MVVKYLYNIATNIIFRDVFKQPSLYDFSGKALKAHYPHALSFSLVGLRSE